MEVVLPTDIEVLKAALYHPLGSIPVEHDHTLGEGAVIDADTYRTTELLGSLYERSEALTHPLVHGLIYLIAPLGDTLGIDIVPGVDTYLLDIL